MPLIIFFPFFTRDARNYVLLIFSIYYIFLSSPEKDFSSSAAEQPSPVKFDFSSAVLCHP